MISIKPFLAVLVSTIGAGLILASDRKPNLREGWSVGAGVIKLLIVLSMAPAVLAGQTIEYTLFTFLPGFDIKFRVDPLGLLFATVASSLWIVTSFYSIGYMRSTHEHKQTRYFTCFAVSLSSAIGVAFSANLLTLFIFYEILSFVTYPLVAHKETEEAFAGAKKYLIYLMGTSKTLLLAAIILTYNIAGTLEFSHDGLFGGKGNPALLTVVYFLFIFGFAKAAIMPVHSWLPAAMVAPTPVSALLHAVAVVKVGVFSVLRVIFHVFGPSLMSELNLGVATAVLASFTILMASIYALTRDNLKARLAYSTVSQLSYVVLGASLLTPSGMLGGILHIANHAVSKITLFFCAGAIYVAS
ncbi:MAG TPA: proton-conducting transporter membrane subunit, partial [Candidatus Manganitrophaceae bacterium]